MIKALTSEEASKELGCLRVRGATPSWMPPGLLAQVRKGLMGKFLTILKSPL